MWSCFENFYIYVFYFSVSYCDLNLLLHLYNVVYTRKRTRYRNFSFSSTRPRIPKCYRPQRWRRYPCPAISIRWLFSCSNLHDVIITFNCYVHILWQPIIITYHSRWLQVDYQSWGQSNAILDRIAGDKWEKQEISADDPLLTNSSCFKDTLLHFHIAYATFCLYIFHRNNSHYFTLLWQDRVLICR